MYRFIIALLTIIGLLVTYPPDTVRADAIEKVHIIEIQTRTEDDANNEFVTLYNASSEPINMTNWQFEYATSSSDPKDDDSWSNKILSADRDKHVTVEPDEVIILGTNNFQDANDIDVALGMASGTRQNGAQLRLQDENNQTVDYVAWGDVEQPLHGKAATAADSDETIARCFIDSELQISTDLTADFAIQSQPLLMDRLDCLGTGGDGEGDDSNKDENDENDNNEPPEDIDENDTDAIENVCIDIIISEVLPNGEEHGPFIELVNKSGSTQSLAECQIEVRSEGGMVRGPHILADIELEPEEYYILKQNHPATQSLFSTVETTIYLLNQDTEIHSTTYPSSMPDDVAWAWFGNNTWEKTSSPTPGEVNNDETEYHINPSCELVMITELLPNPQGPRSQHPRAEHAFIEIYNPTQDNIILDDCGIQAKSSSRSSNVFWLDGYELSPGEYKALYEIDTAIALPVNPSGTVHIIDKTESILDSAVYPESMPEAASWAHIDQEWRITYDPTPGVANQRQDLRPCPDGQERNESTGRCRNIDTAGSELVPCEDHQYRHPETNRCRNIESSNELVPCGPHQYRHPETNRCRNIDSGNDLVPCGPHQERNPETNRCRNIASAETELVPCEDHQYRHPETNRCRNKVLSNEDSIDTVEDVTVVASGTPPSWWLLGAAIIFALGYAIWEWRYDLQNLLRRSRAPAKPSP